MSAEAIVVVPDDARALSGESVGFGSLSLHVSRRRQEPRPIYERLAPDVLSP